VALPVLTMLRHILLHVSHIQLAPEAVADADSKRRARAERPKKRANNLLLVFELAGHNGDIAGVRHFAPQGSMNSSCSTPSPSASRVQ
jgi:hypothetical protein